MLSPIAIRAKLGYRANESIAITFATMKVSVAGTGNAAWHFSRLVKLGGHELVSVWGRSDDRARALASEFDTVVANSIDELGQPDLILLAVSDEAVQGMASRVEGNWLVAHVSGTVPLEFISNDRRGVIWPVQSLTAGIPVDFSEVPFCVETLTDHDADMLRSLVSSFGSPVHLTSGDQRQTLHLAAVFACNFSNHLYHIASGITSKVGVPFYMLHPLIRFTAERIRAIDPEAAQTGPAIRRDTRTIMTHLELLRHDPELANLYRVITQLIQDNHS